MLVAGFSLYRRWFDQRPQHVKFLFHKLQSDRFLSRHLNFTLFCIIPRMFHILLHLNSNVIGRRNGAKIGNVQTKQRCCGYWGATDVAQVPLCCVVQRSFAVHCNSQTTNCLRDKELDASVQRDIKVFSADTAKCHFRNIFTEHQNLNIQLSTSWQILCYYHIDERCTSLLIDLATR